VSGNDLEQPVDDHCHAFCHNCGAACLGVVCARRGEWRTFRAGTVIGVVLGSTFLLQTLGLLRTSASNTGLITGLFAVLFGCLLQGDHLTAFQMTGVAVMIGTMALAELYLQKPVFPAPSPKNA
jgi:drug/metabolite transporter (DMT)-like permease